MKQCYNKGCGKKYDEADNKSDACQHHPGNPIFHDAKKSWSCCNKGSTDFSVFLSLPGCTIGVHNPNKPVEVEVKPKVEEVSLPEISPTNGTPKIAVVKLDRPPVDAPFVLLKTTALPSLQAAIDDKLKQLSLASKEVSTSGDVSVGTACKNRGCTKAYEGPMTNAEICYFHNGAPIFHEGMKYWSCCQRKTSDFDAFMAQVGCTTGKHLWVTVKTTTDCRFDWYQTGTNVCISIFTKAPLLEASVLEANGVCLRVKINYEAGLSHFEREFVLYGIIDPENSNVKFAGTKVEINLKKAEACNWPQLELKTT